MADEKLLRSEERAALQQLAQQSGIEGQRAAALLALDEGVTQAQAAEASGLTVNQVRYVLGKFRSERLLALPDALALLPSEEVVTEPGDSGKAGSRQRRVNRLFSEIDALVNDLRGSLPDAGQYPYSPLRMLTLVRDTAAKYTPDIQQSLLEPFEDMTPEDLVDPDTWKGIAYMIAYSAQFQASQAKGALDKRLPEPVKPETIIQNVRGGVTRLTPEAAKDLAANLEGTSRQDLLDPETWKGLAYMLAYSTQFQAGQAKNKLNEQMPEPLKPDTLMALLTGGIDRITPEVAKQIAASFEGATKEDLLDPDTWKGVWYMLNYSLQFQADQLKERLGGAAQDEEAASE